MMDWDPCLTLEAQGGIFHLLCLWQSGCWDGAKHAPFRGQPGLEMSSWTLQEFSLISGGAIFLCLASLHLAPGTWWTWPSGPGLHARHHPFPETGSWLAGAPRRTLVLCADPSLSPQESLTFHPHCLPQDWLQGQ